MAEQTVTLNPSESKVVVFEATPHEAKTYQVSVNGLAGSFVAKLPPAAKLYIRPDGAGSLTQLTPKSGANWENVDDVSPDDAGSYVYLYTGAWPGTFSGKDLYSLPAVIGEGIINKVTIHFRCYGVAYWGSTRLYARSYIKTNGVSYSGTEYRLPFGGWPPIGSWNNYSQEYTTNPQTGAAWTRDEINALQAGVHLKTVDSKGGWTRNRCTQVYVEVN